MPILLQAQCYVVQYNVDKYGDNIAKSTSSDNNDDRNLHKYKITDEYEETTSQVLYLSTFLEKPTPKDISEPTVQGIQIWQGALEKK